MSLCLRRTADVTCLLDALRGQEGGLGESVARRTYGHSWLALLTNAAACEVRGEAKDTRCGDRRPGARCRASAQLLNHVGGDGAGTADTATAGK